MGQAKQRGTKAERVRQAQARIKQIQKEHPEGSIVIGEKEDFDIPDWNGALNKYVQFCTFYGQNKIPFERGNTMKWGDYVIHYDWDAEGYCDKDSAYLCHYSTGVGIGRIKDLEKKMIWDMESPHLISPDNQFIPSFLEIPDRNGKTATQRAGWSSYDLKVNPEFVDMMNKVLEAA
jgi:hypothetical protein